MLHTEIDFPDEIANQVQATIQKLGGSFEQFIQQAVIHELQRQQADNVQSFFTNSQQPNKELTDADIEQACGILTAPRSVSLEEMDAAIKKRGGHL